MPYFCVYTKTMRTSRHIICSLFFLLSSQVLKAQIDTEFWFAAPEVSVHTSNFDVPLYLNITAMDKNAVVTISLPADNSVTPITSSVAASTSVQIDISSLKDKIENTPPNQILNKGIYIKSTAPVQVYYDVASTYCNCNPELFTLKGSNALGKNFFIPSQTTINNAGFYNPVPKFSFDIVATENNTTIYISPTKNLVGHTAGINYSINLNKGQTYSACASSIQGAEHPAGTFVNSDKPVAITIKDDLLEGLQFAGGCADLTGDQIVPVEICGTNYVVVKGKLGTGNNKKDLACITATRNNTKVYADGNLIATLNAGSNYTYELRADNVYIESTFPIYILHISGIGCELGSALLPPVKCTGSKMVGLKRSSSTLFELDLNIIVPKGAEGKFKANGNTNIIKASDFKAVAGSSEWLTAAIRIDSNFIHPGQSLIVTNESAFFHLGIFEGNVTNGTAYGYISNYNKQETGIKTNYLCHDTLSFKPRLVCDSFRWSDGSKVSVFRPLVPGTYWLDMHTTCETIRDSFIVLRNKVVYKDTAVLILCSSSLMLKTGYLADSFKWNDGSEANSLTVSKPGMYWVDNYANCYQIRVYFEVKDKGKIEPVITYLSCRDSLKLVLARSSDTFRWWNGSVLPFQYVNSAGIYWVEHNMPCGKVRDSTIVSFRDSLITRSRIFCENDILKPASGWRPGSVYQWNTGDTTASIKAGKSSSYRVNTRSDCGMERDSFILFKMNLPRDTAICGTIDLLLDSRMDSSLWNNRSYGRFYTVKSAGTYIAFYNSKYCSGTADTFTVTYAGTGLKVFVPDAFSPNDDGINDIFKPYMEGVSEFRIRIFDRWGAQLYDSDNAHWNASYMNEFVPQGVYMYMLEYLDCRGKYKAESGTVTLIK